MEPNKFIKALFAFILAVLPSLSRGQSADIIIRDSRKQPLAGATVQLTGANTPERLFRAADPSGKAHFDRLSEGLYIVNVTFIGFRPLEAPVNIRQGNNQFEFIMVEDAVLMKEVVVTAPRPVIRQLDDRMIIDVEPVAALSTNTLEILETTPGLLVDQDGGIYLSSATPATVFINGREQKMSTQDIMAILRSLPPGSVQRIEVMRTPSAKYSASASGGIINIILKRGVKIGRYGSVRTGMNQGRYGNRFAGLSMNNSNEKSTGYLNFEYSRNDMLEELNSNRILKTDTTLSQEAETRRKAHQGYLGYGKNFEAGNSVNLNIDGRINGSLPQTSGLNSNYIRAGGGTLLSESDNTIENTSSFVSFRQEFGATWRIDTAGSELDAKLSYAFNNSSGEQHYRYLYIVPAIPEISGRGDINSHGHTIQMQTDLTFTLPLKIKAEAGLSSNVICFRSRSDFKRTISGIESDDPARARNYNYLENINSAYLQLSRNIGWEFQLKSGIRFEHTLMRGNQAVPSDTSFILKRADLFPYLYISRPVIKIAGFDLKAYAIYRKTIARPGFESLSPSVKFIDQYFYETGNPSLKPQFTNNVEFNLSFDEMPIFAIGKNFTRDIFSTVIYRDINNPVIAFRTFDNLGRNRETYFRIVGGIPPTKRYFFYAGAQFNLNKYNGTYEGEDLDFQRGSWRLFTYHAFRITPDMRITLNALLVTRGQMNFYELDNFGQVNLGLNRNFFNKKLSVTLSARDIFRTMEYRFRYQQGTIVSDGTRYSDTRRYGINIIYNFGIPEKQEKGRKMDFNFDD